jgi:hypothetical protein
MKLIPTWSLPGTRNGTSLLTSSWYRQVVLQIYQSTLRRRLIERNQQQVCRNRMICRFITTAFPLLLAEQHALHVYHVRMFVFFAT